jgi:hypothetical protein
MTRYDVQFEMPVNDPVNNVRMRKARGVIHFFVPLNHPDAHNLGLCELIAAVERREKFTVLTGLNNTAGYSGKETLVYRSAQESIKAAASKVETESLCDLAAQERAEIVASLGDQG